MSDIRFNQWLHQSGTGGVTQLSTGHVGIGTTDPLIPVHAGNNAVLNVGVVTANSFYGSGANLTSLPSQVTIANNADNRVITGGSGVNLNGEANLHFDGTSLAVGKSGSAGAIIDAYHATSNTIAQFESGDASAVVVLKDNSTYSSIDQNGTDFIIHADPGASHANSALSFKIDGNERLRIASNGKVGINIAGSDNASPVRNLDIADSSGAILRLISSDDSLGANERVGEIEFFTDDDDGGHIGAFVKAIADPSDSFGRRTALTFGTQSSDNPPADALERLRITSSGSVRVGNNSSYTANANADNLVVGTTNSGNNNGISIISHTNSEPRLIFASSADNDAGMIKYAFSSNIMQFYTNGSEKVRISSAGYVTKPAHPSFHARLINHQNADQNPLYFDDVLVNVGSHYKTSGSDQGKFVVPVAGTYFFFWEAIKNSNGGSVSRLYLMKNGSKTYNNMHLRLQEEGNYANGCMNVVMSLAVGDKIHIFLDDGGVHASEYTHFGGYLIG